MENELKSFVRTDFLGLTPREILQTTPGVLLGVSASAEEELKALEVHSVFDLALSRVFGAARRLTQAADGASDLFRYGSVPADLVDQAAIAGKPLDRLQFEPIAVLEGIGSSRAQTLGAALQVKTIRDLALWPPYRNARLLMQAVLNPGTTTGLDPEAPPELVPRVGQYPTERVTYHAHFLTEIDDGGATTDLGAAGALRPEEAKELITKPAFGAMLRFSHDWYSLGLSLGQLLYSLPLAPGESTKIAVIDFRRRTASSLQEDVSQTESLSNALVQSRAISEVVNAVAKETQSGESTIDTTSASGTSGVGVGAIIPGAPVLIGGAAGVGASWTKTHGVFTSKGRREIASSMQQNISASTQQHSFSARNRHASVVSEAVAEEREQVTTRTVTNYNHMHALTVQYYEVVQMYRTEVRVQDCQRLLFVPMQVLNFTDERLILRHRSALITAALDPYVRGLLLVATGGVDVSLSLPRFLPFQPDPQASKKDQLKAAKEHVKETAKAQARLHLKFNQARARGGVLQVGEGELTSWQMAGAAEFIDVGWDSPIHSVRVAVETGPTLDITENGANRGGNVVNGDLGAAIPVERLREISVEFDEADHEVAVAIHLRFRMPDGSLFSLPCDCVLPAGKTRVRLLRFSPPVSSVELGALLNEHAVYYSQQIWLNTDPHILTMMLARYRYRNKRVIEYIDPRPVTVAGNALGFLWRDEDDEAWRKWKAEHAAAAPTHDLVALPTGGVFAEAVLGRFNSAEKLDLTRFWNWQDSPIPVQAPDIAAIQTGQREGAPAMTAGNLDQPVINIMNPPDLPAPTGMGAALNALTAANMFRDMSGAAQLAAMGQAALQASMQGATSAAAQAGVNMATFAQFQVEMAKLAAALIAPQLAPLLAMASPGMRNPSTAGGAVNLGKELDAIPPGADGGGAAPGGSSGQAGGGTAPGSPSGPTTVPDSSGTIVASTAGSRAGAAFDALIGRPSSETGTATLAANGSAALPNPLAPPVQSDQQFMQAVTLASVRGSQLEGLAQGPGLPALLGTEPAALRFLPVAAGDVRFTGEQAQVIRSRCSQELRGWERFAEGAVISNITQVRQALADVLTEQAVETALGSVPGVDLTTTQAVTAGTGLLGFALSQAFKRFGIVGDAAAATIPTVAAMIYNHWADQQAVADVNRRRERLLAALLGDNRIGDIIIRAVYKVDLVSDFYARWLALASADDLSRFRIPPAPENHDQALWAQSVRDGILGGIPQDTPAVPVPRTEFEALQLLTGLGLAVTNERELKDLLVGLPVRSVFESPLGRLAGSVFRPPVALQPGVRIVVRFFPLFADAFRQPAPTGFAMVHEPSGSTVLFRFSDGTFQDLPV